MKFRVWDKEKRFFKDNFLIDKNGRLCFYIDRGKFLQLIKNDKEYRRDKRYERSYQIEGVQDGNGNDVYEGDFLFYISPLYGKSIFLFSSEKFIVKENSTLAGDFNCVIGRIVPSFPIINGEVIGNIYENTLEELKEKYGVK